MIEDRRQEDRDLRAELEAAGITITTPEERRSFRDDIVWAHQMRQRCEKISGYVVIVIAGGVLTILGSLLLAGFQDWIKRG